jgi:hypothetical protein
MKRDAAFGWKGVPAKQRAVQPFVVAATTKTAVFPIKSGFLTILNHYESI